MRKTVLGKEHIILKQFKKGGFVSVEVDNFTKKMSEIFDEEALKEYEDYFPAGFRNMTFIAVIKWDLAHENRMGWRQHEQLLMEEKVI